MAECSVFLSSGVCVGVGGVSVFFVTFIGELRGAEHTKQRSMDENPHNGNDNLHDLFTYFLFSFGPRAAILLSSAFF